MIVITDRASLASVLDDPDLDLDLRVLINLRARHLSDDARLFIVVQGDTPEVINKALGFEITGDRAEEPSFKWILDLGRWFEIGLLTEGIPTRIFVENGPSTELGLHYLCLSHFWPDGEGDDQ
jgi:hypothetical protein